MTAEQLAEKLEQLAVEARQQARSPRRYWRALYVARRMRALADGAASGHDVAVQLHALASQVEMLDVSPQASGRAREMDRRRAASAVFTAEQMRALATLVEDHGFGPVTSAHLRKMARKLEDGA